MPNDEFDLGPPVEAKDEAPQGEFDLGPPVDATPTAKPIAEDSALHSGYGRAAALGLSQGVTLGFGDELAGVGGAIGDAGNGKSLLENFRSGRDFARKINDQAHQDHSTTYNGNSLAGSLSTLAVPGAASAKLANLAALGAVSGVGNSKADLTTGEGKNYAQAALEGGVGAAVGAGIGVGGKALGALGRSSAGQWVGNKISAAAADALEHANLAEPAKRSAAYLRELVKKYQGEAARGRAGRVVDAELQAASVDPKAIAAQAAAHAPEAALAELQSVSGELGANRADIMRKFEVFQKFKDEKGPLGDMARQHLGDPSFLQAVDKVVENHGANVAPALAKGTDLVDQVSRKSAGLGERTAALTDELTAKLTAEAEAKAAAARLRIPKLRDTKERGDARDLIRQFRETRSPIEAYLTDHLAPKALKPVFQAASVPVAKASSAVLNGVQAIPKMSPYVRQAGVAQGAESAAASAPQWLQQVPAFANQDQKPPMNLNALHQLAGTNPQQFGTSGPAMNQAAQKGKQAVASEFFKQQQLNPQLANKTDEDGN